MCKLTRCLRPHAKWKGISKIMTELEELQLNRRRLQRLFNKIKAAGNDRLKIEAAMYVAEFACSTGHGIWSSPVLEQVFVEASQRIQVSLRHSHTPNTCLFVSTMLFPYGGLERVLERWIETDANWRYSLVLTKQSKAIVPERIAAAISSSGGTVFDLTAHSVLERAAALRELASGYECVVLMAYEEDPLPLLAFGTTEFIRPVGLYNQCDHHFWLNVSIADVVGDLRDWGQGISLNNRGVRKSMIVPVPSEVQPVVKKSRESSRKKLGLPIDRRIVLSVARHMKFRSVAGESFLDLVVPLLEADDSVTLLIIGPTVETVPEFSLACQRFGERFKLLGYVPHEMLYDYYFAADLVVDSYPTDGIAACEDAITCGCPLVSRSSTIDFVVNSKAYCKDNDYLVWYAQRLLSSEEERVKNVTSVTNEINLFSSPAVFMEKRNAFMECLRRNVHSVAGFQSTPTNFIKADYLMLSLGHGFFRRTNLTAWALDIFPLSVGCLCARVFDAIRNLRKRLNKKLRRQR